MKISSAFGFFQWEKTKGDNRITNLFLSKSEVLGILGAVIGLDGYSQVTFKENHKKETNPFYSLLGGLKVSILPQKEPRFFEDHLIHRHMDSINKKGALMVKITGLVKPEYKIVIEKGTVSDEVYQKLKTYLENGWAEFVPYMGKNQYPIEITDVKVEHIEEAKNDDKIKVDSIYKENDVDVSPKVKNRAIVEENEFHYMETLRSFKKDSAQFDNEQYVWSSFPVKLKSSLYSTSEKETITFI